MKGTEIVEESKCIHKKFKETESIKKKENNEDVPTENKEPSLQDYEKLLKKYEKIKKEIHEEKNLEEKLNNELRQIRTKLNMEEFRNKPPIPKTPKKEKTPIKSQAESKNAINTPNTVNKFSKKERSLSQNTGNQNTTKINKDKKDMPMKMVKKMGPNFRFNNNNANKDNIDLDSMTYEDILALEDSIGYVSKGIDESNMDFIPEFIYSYEPSSQNQDDKCPICLKEYEDDDIIKRLFCKHMFHIDCLKEWLITQKFCPICKQNIFEV